MASHLKKRLLERYTKIENAMARSYAEGAIMGGAKVAPVPENAPYATGRSLESFQATNRNPTTYDPGKKGSYKRPTKRSSTFHVRQRNLGDDVVVAMAVHYDWNVERLYHVIKTAHEKGVEKLKDDLPEILRKAK